MTLLTPDLHPFLCGLVAVGFVLAVLFI